MVMALVGAGGDEIETPRRPLINRELGAHSAKLCEQMAQRDAPHLFWNAVGKN